MAWDFDGVDVTLEWAPDDGLFAAAPVWVEITNDIRAIPTCSLSTRARADEPFQPGQFVAEVDNRDREYDLAYGPALVTFDGTNANYYDAGDDAAYSGATALDIRFAMRLTDWTPTNITNVIGQYGAAGQRSWRVRINNTTGAVAIVTSGDGTAIVTASTAGRIAAVDGQVVCGRVTWTTAGTAIFYVKRPTKERYVAECQSNDDWIELDTIATAGTAALFNSTSGIRVGELTDGTGDVTGTVYYAQVATSIDGAPTTVFWPKDAATVGASSWVSSVSGETWTKTGSAVTNKIQGPYYGRANQGAPARLRATKSAVTYDLWNGFVRRVEQQYPDDGTDATARIVATDALGWLAEMAAPETPYGISMATLAFAAGVNAYWPMHEPLSSRQFADIYGSANGVWSGEATAGAASQPASSAPTRLLLDGIYATAPTPVDAINSSGGDLQELPCLAHLVNGAAVFRVGVSDGISTFIICYGVGGNFYISGPSGAKSFGALFAPGAHHFYIHDLGAGITFYVDGIAVELGTYGGAVPTIEGGLYLDGIGSTVSDVVASNTAGIILDSIDTAMSGRALELPWTRLAWLLGSTGLFDTLFDTEPSTFLGPSGAGGTWGSLIAAVNVAEDGRLFVDTDGFLTFQSRLEGLDSSASVATLDDSFADITISPADRSDVVNEVTVTTPSGALGVARDQTSIDLYGLRSKSYSAPVAGADAAQGLARQYLSQSAFPRPRITQVSFDPRTAPSTLFATLLARSIGEKVTLTRRPTGTITPSSVTEPITEQVTIEGIAHTISADGVWRTTWTTLPAPMTAAESGFFTLDDTVLGCLDAGIVMAP